jgi:ectoine hydroxylase-related dioxygenase (phytanoyl-CoA dioxygenase family)
MPNFKRDGYRIVPSILACEEVAALQAALISQTVSPGRRNLMQCVPTVAALAVSSKLLGVLEEMLGEECFPVRSIFFDKTPEANWLVPWHQDLSVAVKERAEIPGYGPWSTKQGVSHVQPPTEILEAMVTIRLHLDDCDESNGALRVIPGSHRLGRLNSAHIAKVRSQKKEVVCAVRAGDAFLMRPLLLHASSQAIAPTHRRVIHLEYASCSLPEGLAWAETATAQTSEATSETGVQNNGK